LNIAIEKSHEEAINLIKRILRTKAIHKRWQNVKKAVKPQSGGYVSRLMVPSESGPTLYATKDGVEEQDAQKLEARFKTAHRAPICMNERLHKDFSFLGDMYYTHQELEGIYDYPENIEPFTKLNMYLIRSLMKK